MQKNARDEDWLKTRLGLIKSSSEAMDPVIHHRNNCSRFHPHLPWPYYYVFSASRRQPRRATSHVLVVVLIDGMRTRSILALKWYYQTTIREIHYFIIRNDRNATVPRLLYWDRSSFGKWWHGYIYRLHNIYLHPTIQPESMSLDENDDKVLITVPVPWVGLEMKISNLIQFKPYNQHRSSFN